MLGKGRIVALSSTWTKGICLLAALLVGGCLKGTGDRPLFVGATSEAKAALHRVAVPKRAGDSSAALQRGMDALVDDQLPDATRHVGQAIALDPRNPTLHFLNGLVYQLRAARG